MHILHPGSRVLQQFADGELPPAAHARASRHLAQCAACRAAVSFRRELGTALRQLDAPSPGPALIERVLADRAAGARAILPVDETARHPTLRRRNARWIGLTGAIAALLIVVVVRGRMGREPAAPIAAGPQAPVETDAEESHFVSGLFLPEAALAAQPAPREGVALPAARLSGRRLHPGRLVYAQLRTGTDGRTTEVGRGTIDVAPASIDGQAAWRTAHLWRFGGATEAETLFVDRSSLRFLGRTTHVAPYLSYHEITIRQRGVGDSVVGWMNTERGLGRPIARRLPPESGPYVTDGFAPLALAGTELSVGWSGRLSVLGWAVRSGDVHFPVELRVVGEERITVPAGTFDCWRLSLRAHAGMQAYWIRKADGLGIRSRDDAPRDGRGPKETVLVSG